MDDMLSEVEQAITLPMITGALPNERLRRTIELIDRGDYAGPLARIRAEVARHPGVPVSLAFVAAMHTIRAAQPVDAAELQILVIGFYRVTWKLLSRLDPEIDLEQIRLLDAAAADRLCGGFTFGRNAPSFPVPPEMAARFSGRLRSLMRPEGADEGWEDLSGEVARCKQIAAPDPRRGPSSNGMRNGFFNSVFREYLGPDNVDDRLRHEHRLVLDFLEDAERNPQLLPFLQGQAPSQVRFRIAQLTMALIAMHQLDAQAAAPSARRMRLREAAIACLYAPFPGLVGWVHARLDRLWVPLVSRAAPSSYTGLDPVTGPFQRKAPSGSERLAAVR
ncbi:MAG: hypothetical protein H0X38_03555 [Planctomycetes bacterium]|nr:hypothetical protein [Planctomycetota bacterium]